MTDDEEPQIAETMRFWRLNSIEALRMMPRLETNGDRFPLDEEHLKTPIETIRQNLSSVTAFQCTSLGNKKPAKPGNLRVFVSLCIWLDAELVLRPESKIGDFIL